MNPHPVLMKSISLQMIYLQHNRINSWIRIRKALPLLLPFLITKTPIPDLISSNLISNGRFIQPHPNSISHPDNVRFLAVRDKERYCRLIFFIILFEFINVIDSSLSSSASISQWTFLIRWAVYNSHTTECIKLMTNLQYLL